MLRSSIPPLFATFFHRLARENKRSSFQSQMTVHSEFPRVLLHFQDYGRKCLDRVLGQYPKEAFEEITGLAAWL